MRSAQPETAPPETYPDMERPEAVPAQNARPHEAPNRPAAEADESDPARDIGKIRQSVQTALDRHAPVLPAAASSLANRLVDRPGSDSLRLRTVTADEIKQQKPWLGTVSRLIGFFSSGLARRFDGYIARKGQERIDRAAQKIATYVNVIGTYEAPREQFMAEIATMRDFIAHGGLDGKGPGGPTPESRLAYIVDGVTDSGKKWRGKVSVGAMYWLEQNCPMIRSSLSVFMNPMRSALVQSYRGKVQIVPAEILAGLDHFLGRKPSAPTSPDAAEQSLGRFVGERFRGGLIHAVPTMVTDRLRQVYQMLPDNGPDFKQRVITVANQTATADNPRAQVLNMFDEYYRTHK